MKKRKKILIRFGYVVFGLCALVAAAWFMPFPIEGNWDDSVRPCSFLRIENGKFLAISEDSSPPYWFGTYEKKGWGKYEITWLHFEPVKSIVRTTFLRMRMYGNVDVESATFTRNLSVLTCRKILNAPENEWMERPYEIYRRVSGTAEERSFALGNSTFPKEEIEEYLNTLLKQPVQIYTASNEVPASIIEALAQNGFDYQVHTKQQWITDEWRSYWNNPDANPLWTNHTFNIIIRMPSDSDKTEDPAIYYWRGNGGTFEHLQRRIEEYRNHRDTVKNDFYLYVKDGILPEDVRQMFDALGINYHVRDEKTLYRGKRAEQRH